MRAKMSDAAAVDRRASERFWAPTLIVWRGQEGIGSRQHIICDDEMRERASDHAQADFAQRSADAKTKLPVVAPAVASHRPPARSH